MGDLGNEDVLAGQHLGAVLGPVHVDGWQEVGAAEEVRVPGRQPVPPEGHGSAQLVLVGVFFFFLRRGV